MSARNYTLETVIDLAYGLMEFQLLSRPGWLGVERFDIEAASEGRQTVDACNLMVQSLLAERCALKVHTETRQARIYKLVVVKKGAKLQRLAPDALLGTEVFSSGIIVTKGVTMETFAEMLASSREFDSPVVDETGLEGNYKFEFHWSPTSDGTGPSLFSALQEQLGLKLEPAKGPVKFLVIDHIERPSAN